ncbi:MAG: nitroreductase family protein [Candidatus Omnitrophota bacterium]
MEFNKLIETRRAVNFFDPAKQVSDEELKKIVAMASLAPSSFNLQPWNLIVAKSMEAKIRLRKKAMDQPKITEAPVVLIVLADKTGYQEGDRTVEQVWASWEKNGYMKPEQKGWFLNATRKLYGGDTPSLIFSVKNVSFFGMSLMLAAQELGLDTHPMDGFDHDGIMAEFKIPANYYIPLLIAVGHFDQTKKLLPRNWRKPYEQIVLSTI